MSKKILLVAIMVLGLAQVAVADLVTNGGFETTTATAGGYMDDYGDIPVDAFTGWTASNASLGGYPGVVYGTATGNAGSGRTVAMGAANGNVAATLETISSFGSNLATFSQTLSGVAANDYIVSIDALDTNYSSAASLEVLIDGTAVLSFTPSAGDDVWQTFTSAAVSLSAGDHTLAIRAVADVYPVSAIDNVSINAVPEPGTLALLIAAGLGLAIWARKRK